MFYECENLIYVNFRNIDTSNVESMYGMFMFCYSLENVDLGNLNAENARFLSYMFFSCKSLKSVILPYAKNPSFPHHSFLHRHVPRPQKKGQRVPW